MANIGDRMVRDYGNFRGVDFLNPANKVDLSRSPDALNVWKSYDTTESNIVQTRPGYKKIAKLEDEPVNGFYVYSKNKAIIHVGTKLLVWEGFLETMTS